LSDERLRELLEVQAYFGLPSPALVEKDYYVVKALAAIAAMGPTRVVGFIDLAETVARLPDQAPRWRRVRRDPS
jgi:hypothetical protein